jgi:hypothetical protein
MRVIPPDIGGTGTPFVDAIPVVTKRILGREWRKRSSQGT